MKVLCTLLLICGLVLPYVSLATTTATTTETEDVSEENQPVRIRGFCATIERLGVTIDEQFSERQLAYTTKRVEIEQRILESRRSLEDEFIDARTTFDNNVEKHLELMYVRASTTEEKDAVAVFEGTLLKALEVRYKAVDDAVDNFKLEMDEILLSRKNDVEEATRVFAEEIKKVLEEASAQCLRGGVVTRASVASELRITRKNFEVQLRTFRTLPPIVSEISKKRKEAVALAQNEFKSSIQKAITDLKKVMK